MSIISSGFWKAFAIRFSLWANSSRPRSTPAFARSASGPIAPTPLSGTPSRGPRAGDQRLSCWASLLFRRLSFTMRPHKGAVINEPSAVRNAAENLAAADEAVAGAVMAALDQSRSGEEPADHRA